MRNSWIVGLIVVVLAIGGFFWWQHQSAAPALSDDGTPAAVDAADDAGATPTGQTTTTNNPGGTDYAPGNTNTDAPGSLDGSVSANATAHLTSVTVTYNGSTFSPASVTIQKGGTVHFVSTSGGMWVASDVHPSHTDYDGTSRAVHCAAGYTGAAPFDQCASGTSYSFTFTKTGTFTYHDHMNAGVKGTVIVQ